MGKTFDSKIFTIFKMEVFKSTFSISKAKKTKEGTVSYTGIEELLPVKMTNQPYFQNTVRTGEPDEPEGRGRLAVLTPLTLQEHTGSPHSNSKSHIYCSSWLMLRLPFCTSSSSALTIDGSMAAYLVPWNCSKCICT